MELGSDKVAVVTGAASGIGLALAESLARSGCSLVLADVQEDALSAAEARISEYGVETMAVITDVSKMEQVDALAVATVDRFGGAHVVCNNAGVGGGDDPWFGGIEAWEWTLGVNLWGVIHGIRAFLPHLIMSGGGHIVNTASIAGLTPGAGAAYDASKHAVVAISENLYHGMKTAGLPIGVSCLCPGWVKTGIADSSRNWPEELGEAPVLTAAQEVSMHYLRRAIDEGMQPGAVADLVVGAIEADRYWVFPHPDFLEMAMARFHSIGEGVDPSQPEQTPGMPPRDRILAEVLAAMDAAPGG